MQPEHRFTSQVGAGSRAQHLFGAAIIKCLIYFSVTGWKQSRCSVHVTGIDGGIAVAVGSLLYVDGLSAFTTHTIHIMIVK